MSYSRVKNVKRARIQSLALDQQAGGAGGVSGASGPGSMDLGLITGAPNGTVGRARLLKASQVGNIATYNGSIAVTTGQAFATDTYTIPLPGMSANFATTHGIGGGVGSGLSGAAASATVRGITGTKNAQVIVLSAANITLNDLYAFTISYKLSGAIMGSA